MSTGLTERQRQAATAIAKADRPQHQIATALGIRQETIVRWRRNPQFIAAIDAESERIRAEVRAEGIANRQNRIDAYNDRWLKMQQVIDERAADTTLKAPGASTGLIVRTYKQVGSGRDAQLVEEFSVDTALLAEMRATEKQAAQELHEWSDGKPDGNDGGTASAVTIQIAALDYRLAIAPLAPRSMANSAEPGED